MKYLIIASYPASILKFRGALIKALQDKGFEIHVAAPEFEVYPEECDSLIALGYTVHDIPMQRTGTNPLKDAKTLSALYLLMKKIKPDYVLGYTIKPVIYGSLAAKLARVPHIFALITGLGYAFSGADEVGYKKSNLQKVMHQLYAAALLTTDKVFFQNPDDQALFKKMGILKPSTPSTVVNGSGVNVSEYSVAPLPTENGESVPRFLLIARLLGAKGVREYAQAAAIIKSRHPNVRFDLVGWVDDNPDSIEQRELDAWIEDGLFNFLGKLNDVKSAIADSSVYVLPSYREGTPRTVLEAMAMGRAVITTDAPGCRETVVDGHNGYLVPVKDVNALAAAMERFITDPQLIASMGSAARQVAMDKFDVNTVNQMMLTEMGIQ
ncbi:glycosyltransferase family 4 protein [Psychrobacter pacificensis]|uniref:glycosyltransferase family 4 protein n=1 Tax=Psychrobacter pacificensis TaxID=112002 RepID=UPI001CBE27F9|nr:glycosyltransferase family 4 protein [Psychrobacter pacificensis]MBZ1392359.1 glycosyltransferase family 4 protein [Psychrobacter pacificensis]